MDCHTSICLHCLEKEVLSRKIANVALKDRVQTALHRAGQANLGVLEYMAVSFNSIARLAMKFCDGTCDTA
jgi:hypothetical protein